MLCNILLPFYAEKKIIHGMDSRVSNDMLTCDFAIQRTFDMQIGVVVQNHRCSCTYV